MKIKFNKLLIATISIILCTSSIYAQRGAVKQYADPLMPAQQPTPLYIGPALGINYMGHSMDIPTFAFSNCPNFENANGLGIYAGITLEHLFGEVATSSSSLIFRILFNMFPGSVTVNDNSYPMRDAAGNVVNNLTENVMDIDYNAITFEVMYKINPIPGNGLGIVVGPSLDYIMTKNRTHEYNIVSPLEGRFDPSLLPDYAVLSNNNRTATMYDGEIEDASSIRFGLKAGVQYELLLGTKWYIVPSVAYNFGITSVTSKYTWRVSPLQAGVDIRFAW
ncbi:MAG: hypothetical protein LBO69_08945 [Ignavibacteria bacterium]|jgi:hypothetical protein|nr:hypothetical protein [Ignavibacteria bacterium]